MKHKLLIILVLQLFLLPCLHSQTEIDTVAVTKYLQKKYGFKSPVEILQYETKNDGTTPTCVVKIVGKGKENKVHKQIKTTYKNTFKKSDIKMMNAQYGKYFLPEQFRYIFVPIYKYKGDYYAYQGCDFQSSFILTDSYYAPSYMDGVYAYPIVEFLNLPVNNSVSITTSVLPQEYTIGVVNVARNIYKLLNNGKFVGYFTPVDNVPNFEIIAEDCYQRGFLFKDNFEQE